MMNITFKITNSTTELKSVIINHNQKIVTIKILIELNIRIKQ